MCVTCEMRSKQFQNPTKKRPQYDGDIKLQTHKLGKNNQTGWKIKLKYSIAYFVFRSVFWL